MENLKVTEFEYGWCKNKSQFINIIRTFTPFITFTPISAEKFDNDPNKDFLQVSQKIRKYSFRARKFQNNLIKYLNVFDLRLTAVRLVPGTFVLFL